MVGKGGIGCGSGEIGAGTYVVGSNVCPEDIIPFLKFALQQLLRELLNIIRLFISLSRPFSGDTRIVESTISFQSLE